MRYLITKSRAEGGGQSELTRAEFDEIRAAKRGVFFALVIEERFAMVRENYREYEREIFEIAQREVLYFEWDWSERVNDIYAVNRRLLNFLATSRLYRDQLSTGLTNRALVPSATSHAIRMAREQEIGQSVGFEFLESIRNTIQHKLLPVTSGGRTSSVDERSDGSRMLRHTADPRISLGHLMEEKQISGALFAKMRPRAVDGDLLMLNPLVRDYMLVLGKVHRAVQENLAELVTAWDKTYLAATERGALLRCEFEDDDDELNMEPPSKTEDLFGDLIGHRKYLQGRATHAHMMPTARDYISTE